VPRLHRKRQDRCQDQEEGAQMIFGRMSDAGREFVLVGLSDDNLREMKAGEPITIGPVPGDPALAAMQIILVCGDTEQDMMKALKKDEPESTKPCSNENP
jgi:hypothetical protein